MVAIGRWTKRLHVVSGPDAFDGGFRRMTWRVGSATAKSRDEQVAGRNGRRDPMKSASLFGAVTLFMALAATACAADANLIELSVKDHKFAPAELKAVAGNAIVLKIRNLDATPIEFESMSLEFEVVVKSNTELLVKVKPQKPGNYLFFDDLHQEAKGTLVVK
jgi:hypothetical protein